MQHILEKIDGWVQNGPMGNDKNFIEWLVPALVGAAVDVFQSDAQRSAYRASATAQRELAQKNYETQVEALKKARAEGTRMGAGEAIALQRMEKGAREGTMDVDSLTQQATAPVYQVGAESRQQAQGKVITQGLEGSIIAQEVARKIDTQTMQNIAQQARQIALANEATKAQASQALTTAQLSRAERLKQIAMDYQTGLGQAEIARDQALHQATISDIQAEAAKASTGFNAATGFATASYMGIAHDLITLPDGSYYDPNA